MCRALSRLLLGALVVSSANAGLLHPQRSETREVLELDGMWRFKMDSRGSGFDERWYESGLTNTVPIAVPSSFNDMEQDMGRREHVGLVWYERDDIFVPRTFSLQRVVLYVGSANHHAIVYLNGERVGSHVGGHLPFHLPLEPPQLLFGQANRLTIAINNTLSTTTIPPGFVQVNAAGRKIQRLQMDFFNYAGIHRSVQLYTTPKESYLDDLHVTCTLDGPDAQLSVFASTMNNPPPPAPSPGTPPPQGGIIITLKDADHRVITRGRMVNDPRRGGRLKVEDAKLWWPRYMSDTPGYRYTIIIEVIHPDGRLSDVYRIKYGIRTVEAGASTLQQQASNGGNGGGGGGFLINGRPFYFAGFGKHEDSDFRGRGADLPQLVKDFRLLDWIGANSIRTTHYPFSEDFLELCDEHGIVVIGEAPAVGLQGANFVRETLKAHLEAMTELVTRDKNRPSVVMWSLANEPDSEAAPAATYFQHLVQHVRMLDPHRPLTFASFKSPEKDVVAPFVDVVMVNKYVAWYTSTGQLDIIHPMMRKALDDWYRAHRKPVMISEFGADAVAGMHADTPISFTEEFQVEYIRAHYPAFDETRRTGYFFGEHVWNWADFMTAQGVTRVVGNKKGIFTRQRQPKLAAHTVRARYLRLANATQRWPLSLAALAALSAPAQGGGFAAGGGGGGWGGGPAAPVESTTAAPVEANSAAAAAAAAAAAGDGVILEAEAAVRAATDLLQEGAAFTDEAAISAEELGEVANGLNAAAAIQDQEQMELGGAGGAMGATHVWQG